MLYEKVMNFCMNFGLLIWSFSTYLLKSLYYWKEGVKINKKNLFMKNDILLNSYEKFGTRKYFNQIKKQ